VGHGKIEGQLGGWEDLQGWRENKWRAFVVGGGLYRGPVKGQGREGGKARDAKLEMLVQARDARKRVGNILFARWPRYTSSS
jgi:hypothetical protein